MRFLFDLATGVAAYRLTSKLLSLLSRWRRQRRIARGR